MLPAIVKIDLFRFVGTDTYSSIYTDTYVAFYFCFRQFTKIPTHSITINSHEHETCMLFSALIIYTSKNAYYRNS